MSIGNRALIVIDIQNDYFPGGQFPLWNAEGTLANVEQVIGRAREQGVHVIIIQHVAGGPAPFFNRGTPGVELHPRICALTGDAPRVVKQFADGFHQTNLEETLARLEVEELLICGMMTQNCVTHTSISKAAEKYNVAILSDCCTTVSEILDKIALNGLSTRVSLIPGVSL